MAVHIFRRAATYYWRRRTPRALAKALEGALAGEISQERPAICMDKAITYGELDEMSAAIGAYLQSRGSRREPVLRS